MAVVYLLHSDTGVYGLGLGNVCGHGHQMSAAGECLCVLRTSKAGVGKCLREHWTYREWCACTGHQRPRAGEWCVHWTAKAGVREWHVRALDVKGRDQ